MIEGSDGISGGRAATVLAIVLAAAVIAAGALPDGESGSQALPVIGLDHIPLAVADLDAAAEDFRRLGFTLKPGRPHENGIRNQHVKFLDGTEIELITAVDARDALTNEYVEHLAGGDGPAFVAFYAPEMDRVARYLDGVERVYLREEALLCFPETDPLRYIFLGQRNASPTDRPEHFAHANGAEALIGVWIAGDRLTAERDLLSGLGATITDEEVHVPDAAQGSVARLPQGEVVFLSGARQLVPGRKIVGATLRVRDLKTVRSALAKTPCAAPTVVRSGRGSSVFLPPEITHGVWLEFREER